MSMIGKSLVHYEITAEIGKGGMGEVYQAKDTKLGREVAIKVLPEEFALDTDRVARFQREAKLLASLNHPNIAAIYGLEESEGIHFLVMELIEGDTLRDRIKSGPIPVEEALQLALQMAEALEAAHEKGVIHRDLKPANIKVTPDGKVKILDFGLAKAYVGDQGNVSPVDSPTISAAATQQGVILGTAAYMSPEQARGKAVDRRADIWAFGVVLYEMLTGKTAFSGEDVTSTVARVLEREPEFSTLPQNLHPRIQFMIERCLKKDPKDRYSGISDARVDAQSVLADPIGVFTKPDLTGESPRKQRAILPWIAVTAVLCLIISGVAVWQLKPPEPRQLIRFEYQLPADHQLDLTGNPFLAISPDGGKLVYKTANGLYLRLMNQPTAKLIVDNKTVPRQPFISPDGQWVGYWSEVEKNLKKISISGGAPVTIVNTAGNPVLPSWNDDNTIVYGEFGTGKIMRVSANGGTPELLFETQGKMSFAPQILPDGESILVTQLDGSEYQIVVQSLKSGKSTELMSMQGTVSRYLPTGHIVYTVGNNLFAVPFDLDKLEVIGGQVSVGEEIRWDGGTAAPQYAISDSGTLIYSPGIAEGAIERTLVWVDREGNEEPLNAPSNHYRVPKVSPDGTKIASAVVIDGNQDIYIWDIDHENMMRLTFDEGADDSPLWTLDGKRIVFQSAQEEGGLCWKAADGTGEVDLLFKSPGTPLLPWSWSKDGNTLVFMDLIGGTQADISILSMEGEYLREPLLQEEYPEGHPRISPDGRYIAYMSNESGDIGIYVRPFPEVNKGKWQVSTTQGQSPLWSPDGRELFYLSEDAIMAVPVNTESTFSYEKPRELFRGDYVTGWTEDPPFDIHPDGKRFIMMKAVETESDESTTEPPNKINIVINWFEELKQRVPVD